MKQITPAAANKMVRKLEDEKSYLISMMNEMSTYIEAEGVEPVIPEFNYENTISEIMAIDEKIAKIKHCINVFNTSTTIPEIGITVDQALVKMAQLNHLKNYIDRMRKRQKKCRYNTLAGTIIQYECVNYDIEKTKADYEKISNEIIDIQMSLDKCNQTIMFDLDI